MTTRQRLSVAATVAATIASGAFGFGAPYGHRASRPLPVRAQATRAEGQTTTLLPNGRLLLLGGETAGTVSAAAAIEEPSSGTRVVLPTSMSAPRAGHTATVLPDGTVLIIGGRQQFGAPADVAELFDPSTGTFTPVAFEGGTSRVGHSATLLTDGRVLVAGGMAGGQPTGDVEIWDVSVRRAAAVGQMSGARSGHTATLLDDGRVALTGGTDAGGRTMSSTDIYDPVSRQSAQTQSRVFEDATHPRVAAWQPPDGAADVPTDVRLSMRFSRPIRVTTLSSDTIQLQSVEGPVPISVVAAEGGRLVFITPRVPLADDLRHTLSIAGAVDVAGRSLPASRISFTTAKASKKQGIVDNEPWIPDATSAEHGWRANRPPSPWETLPPLVAPPGTTAISGRVLTLDGRPLAGVTLRVEGDVDTQSDRTGRFLLVLRSSATTRRVLQIDGVSASNPNRRYGFFEYGFTVTGGITNILAFTIWQPRLDTAHEVSIASPTTAETVIKTPYIPGLELHLPAGTVIRDEDGKPVTRAGITAIPVDRPPFPLAKNVEVPVYFTIQPGGAYVSTTGPGPRGAWLVYPNYKHFQPGQRVQFFHYDPDVNGWYVYGLGTANASQVVPDSTTRIYAFTGAMINGGGSPPNDGPPPGDCCRKDGDPVDLATGLFTLESTDLYLPDVIPVAVTRTYRQRDTIARPFGVGTTHPYAMFLYDSGNAYQQADLILPDGGRIHYVRITPGSGFSDAVFSHQETATTSATPTAFYKSTMRWNGNGWDVTLLDGTVYVFGENAPLQAIRDRFGNQVTIAHSDGQRGDVTQVTSPNGRWVTFTYDAGRITQAIDNIGRTVSYGYNAAGDLTSVTDPENHVTSYTYDANHQMLTVKPPSLQGTQTNLVTNEYTTSADDPTWLLERRSAGRQSRRYASESLRTPRRPKMSEPVQAVPSPVVQFNEVRHENHRSGHFVGSSTVCWRLQ